MTPDFESASLALKDNQAMLSESQRKIICSLQYCAQTISQIWEQNENIFIHRIIQKTCLSNTLFLEVVLQKKDQINLVKKEDL